MHYDKLQQSSILRKLYSFDFPPPCLCRRVECWLCSSFEVKHWLLTAAKYGLAQKCKTAGSSSLRFQFQWQRLCRRADKCFFLQIPPKRYLSFQAKIALICPPIPFPHSAEANMLRHLRRKLNSPAKYLLNRCVCRHIDRLTHHPSETQLGKMEIQHNLFWGRIAKY